MIEKLANELGMTLIAFHTTAQGALQLILRPWSGLPAELRLDGVVEVLVRIEFRAVRRKEEQLDVLATLFNPLTNLPGPMYLKVVHDKKHLATCRSDKSLQELDERGDLQAAAIHHETEHAAIGKRRNHAHGEACSLSSGDGRATLWRVATSAMILATDARLITPHDLCTLSFGPFFDTWVDFAQPPPNSRWLLLVSAFPRTLRSESPSPQVIANRPDGHLDSICTFNQLLDCLSRPQRERHLQLFGCLVDDHATNPLLLCRRKRPASSMRPSAPAKLQSTHSTLSVQRPPLAYGRLRHLQKCCDFAMLVSFTPQRNSSMSQFQLRRRTQFPGVSRSHEHNVS